MLDLDMIEKPTLLLDESRARRNLARMAARIRRQGVRFRPHFKTHQSAEIGEWFRAEGVEAITVSSTDMADYFTRAGWRDILIAFSANPRQAGTLDELAGRVHLELLVEAPETVTILEERLEHAVDVWIKVDVGSRRTGIPVDQHERIIGLARAMHGPRLHFRGLLAHAGQTYHASRPEQVLAIYHRARTGMIRAREALAKAGFRQVELSYGDTPSCSLADDYNGLDELRPGNFIFYDLTQHRVGACSQDDIAVAVACPVVAKHVDSELEGINYRLVLHGGAVHLSKECLTIDGDPFYGGLARLNTNGWGEMLPGARLYSLSQEHGLARVTQAQFESVQVGDLLAVVPVHSCLVVDMYNAYLTTSGRHIAIQI